MSFTTDLTTRAGILQAIRRCSDLADLAPNDDTRILLKAGIMPKSFLTSIHPDRVYPSGTLDYLISHKKVIQSDTYLKANPKDRVRPIATNYDIEKPSNISRLTRNPVLYRLFGKDRLALWYAAANHDFSGSKGEAQGLWAILQFWRLSHIQRNWRVYIKNPRFKLPEDAK